MNSITKLAAVALGAMSIAGGVAVAQVNAPSNDGRTDTANYGTPAGAPLKRDGSLGADPQPTATVSGHTRSHMRSNSGNSTTSTSNTDASSAADTSTTAPAATSTPDASLQPRADRN